MQNLYIGDCINYTMYSDAGRPKPSNNTYIDFICILLKFLKNIKHFCPKMYLTLLLIQKIYFNVNI